MLDRLALALIALGLVGCALQTHYHDDPFRTRIRACASVIDGCKVSAW
jgi:hypothetical protein